MSTLCSVACDYPVTYHRDDVSTREYPGHDTQQWGNSYALGYTRRHVDMHTYEYSV